MKNGGGTTLTVDVQSSKANNFKLSSAIQFFKRQHKKQTLFSKKLYYLVLFVCSSVFFVIFRTHDTHYIYIYCSFICPYHSVGNSYKCIRWYKEQRSEKHI